MNLKLIIVHHSFLRTRLYSYVPTGLLDLINFFFTRLASLAGLKKPNVLRLALLKRHFLIHCSGEGIPITIHHSSWRTHPDSFVPTGLLDSNQFLFTKLSSLTGLKNPTFSPRSIKKRHFFIYCDEKARLLSIIYL